MLTNEIIANIKRRALATKADAEKRLTNPNLGYMDSVQREIALNLWQTWVREANETLALIDEIESLRNQCLT